MNYYNEWDKKAAAWLRQLIKDGLIPPGDVDERSITEIKAHELAGYTQCHFFAGIGGWSLALAIAGWDASKPVWTGSCPCQPFSVAGSGLGTADERHLWPAFFNLIRERRPATVFGEQVASPLGREWLTGVRADLEGVGYAVGGADLCAAGVQAPQIRQRLYWVAHAASSRCERPLQGTESQTRDETRMRLLGQNRGTARLGNGDFQGPQGRGVDWHGSGQWAPWSSSVGVLGNDGKRRRIEPSVPPVAARLPSRVALIRGSGNAIVPQVAAHFIMAATA